MGYTNGSLASSILRNGTYATFPAAGFLKETSDRIYELVLEGISEVVSPDARSYLEEHSLTQMHEVMPAENIGDLRNYVMERYRRNLFDTVCRFARESLGLAGEFYVDDYAILRINYPYEIAKLASMNTENPGIGRMSKGARSHFVANKREDPVYDPKGYQRNLPPAAWAHGPHQDTWTGHSRDGINLWWAVEKTIPENSMVFYPDYWGHKPRPDPRSLYLHSGYPLSEPKTMQLARGELLVFNPEILHGTHLNVSSKTRVAVSLRINPERPTFSRHCFYAREYWQSSTNIEAGKFDEIIHFERTQNFMDPAKDHNEFDKPTPYKPIEVTGRIEPGAAVPCGPVSRFPFGEKVLLKFDNASIIVVRSDEKNWNAYDSECPHLGVSLMDGYSDGEKVYCPGCAVKFSLSDGSCMAPSLRLGLYRVKVENSVVSIVGEHPG